MWYSWITLLLVSCALVSSGASGAEAPAAAQATPASTRAPPLTLDRQNNELAWHVWLQSPDNSNQNAPPRRITTKSLFITPLICPTGHRLDGNSCVQVVTVNKDEHERILLEQLNALFPTPTSDVEYDYGDDSDAPGPLQLSIPIGLDPHASPLQALEPSAQAQEVQPNYVQVNKKDENKPAADASIEAELELLKLQHSQNLPNVASSSQNTNILNHNVLSNLMLLQDKPKRDSPIANATEILTAYNSTDQGQKELIYGHVNIDPVLYKTENLTSNAELENEKRKPNEPPQTVNLTFVVTDVNENTNDSVVDVTDHSNKTSNVTSASTSHVLKNDADKTKLNPENDYADIGEAIKLISRYAEVTTDDNFSKDQKKYAMKDDSVLGTRTKLQHRRNKPKLVSLEETSPARISPDYMGKENLQIHNPFPRNEAYYYRYPWQSQNSPTPPSDYPFRHLQDYWPGRSQMGGVYNTAHENPRRHHHNYPHSYLKPHGYPYASYPGSLPGLPENYASQMQGFPHRSATHHGRPTRSHTNNQDLYSLLGLRHWFSSEGTSKR